LAKANFIGAASAAVTFGIGTAAVNLFANFYSQAAFQAAAHGTFQGSMTTISGGKFWSGFAAGALSSMAASAWSGGSTETTGFSQENNWAYGAKTITHTGLGAGTGTIGMIAFGTVSGGVGARLTGGNFWEGAITGLVVSGLNHAMHSDDNGYDKNGKQINKNGGDTTDYRYDDKGKIIESTNVKFIGGISQGKFRELGGFRGYGFRGLPMATGAITDDSLNFTSNLFAIGEIYRGGKLIYMGLTTIPKASVGIRVVLGGSVNALKSSVYYEGIIGSQSINVFGVKSLPTLYSTAYTWATFLGRNAPIIGAIKIGTGGVILYN